MGVFSSILAYTKLTLKWMQDTARSRHEPRKQLASRCSLAGSAVGMSGSEERHHLTYWGRTGASGQFASGQSRPGAKCRIAAFAGPKANRRKTAKSVVEHLVLTVVKPDAPERAVMAQAYAPALWE